MKMKKIIALALSCALTVGLLAGCGGDKKPESGSNEIVIGLLANTTGGAAVYGISVRNGAMLYIDELNAKGGINGKTVKVIEYDDKGEATEAINAYSRLVSDGITAVIGSVLTGPTIAVADETFEGNMPQITASATAAGVTRLDPGNSNEIRSNVFRACFIDPFQGEKMAQYAAEKLNAKTAAVIYETGSDYSEGLMEAFVAKCAQEGITVTNTEAYATGDKAFQAQLTNIAASQPDVIFCPNYYEDDGLIVTQARQVGVTGTFLGGDGWAGVKDYASAADLEGSVYCSGYGSGANPEFESAYEAKYGEPITGMFEPLGYDAAMLLCAAIAEAEKQGLEAGSDAYKQAIIDAMKATNGLEGLTGTFAFDQYNDPIKSASMMKLEGGAEVFTELF